MNIQLQKLKIQQEELIIEINKYRSQYNIDRRGWVTYKNGKRKKKLRNYVADLALILGRLNKKPYSENRSLLIEYYNKDGIQGINRAAKVATEEHYNRAEKS